MGVRLHLAGNTAEVVIDNPATRNAISIPVMKALDEALTAIEASPARAVVLKGAGERVFVSGGDLKDLDSLRDFDSAEAMAIRMRGLLDRIATFPVPVICALNGDAYGGGAEIAMACDFRIAAANIHLGFNQISLAITPAWGGIERLATLIGRSRALYLILTGRILEGQELWEWGLVEELVEREHFDDRCAAVARFVADLPEDVVTGIRSIVRFVEPSIHPNTASTAVASFARTWIAEEHWKAVEVQQEARKRRRQQNSTPSETGQ